MSKRDALVARLLRKPKDFTLNELDTVMKQHNCEKGNRGRTSGSAITYTHIPTQNVFQCHRPHPQNTLKPYVIKKLIQFLREIGEIGEDSESI